MRTRGGGGGLQPIESGWESFSVALEEIIAVSPERHVGWWCVSYASVRVKESAAWRGCCEVTLTGVAVADWQMLMFKLSVNWICFFHLPPAASEETPACRRETPEGQGDVTQTHKHTASKRVFSHFVWGFNVNEMHLYSSDINPESLLQVGKDWSLFIIIVQ